MEGILQKNSIQVVATTGVAKKLIKSVEILNL